LLSIRFIDEDGEVGTPAGEEYTLSWSIADETYAIVIGNDDELSSYNFRIEGKQAGASTLTIILNHNNHKDFESAKIPVIVTL
jgi:hypothetical protein